MRLVLFGIFALLVSRSSSAEEVLLLLEQKEPHPFQLRLFRPRPDDDFVLVLKSPLLAGEPEVQALPDPSRVVVDARGLNFATNKTFKIESSDEIKAVRFGKHAETGRIVVDLTGGPVSQVKVKNEEQSVTVSFKPGESAGARAGLRSEELLPPQNPAEQKSHGAPETNTIKVNPKEKVPPLASEVLPMNEKSRSAISEITFEVGNAVPYVLISVSSDDDIPLGFKDNRTFSLVIPSCSLASKNLALPQVAPPEFAGIRFVQAAQKGSDCQVLIGVDPGIKLSISHGPHGLTLYKK